jgi:hypothetical protein
MSKYVLVLFIQVVATARSLSLECRPAPHRTAAPKALNFIARLALALLVLRSAAALGHETDQYTLPVGRQFADLGPYFSHTVHGAIVAAVKQTNAAIKRSLRHDQRPTERTLRLQSADQMAGEVWAQLFAAFPMNEILDRSLARAGLRAQYPGLIVSYAPEQSIYDDPLLLLDLTKLIRLLFRASTVSADGKLFGTDKIIHFINLGRIYHSSYLSARKQGLGEWEASFQTRTSIASNPLLSEDWMLGMLTTGIHSNADLAADYAGFKFYRNLTEEVHIGNRVMPPILVQEGLYWRLNDQVRPESDFFTAFITPHWNEALNPNVYGIASHARLRAILRSRCPDLLDWYRDERGRPLTRPQFAQIEEELSTFYGEPYGYESDGSDTVSIATTCFQEGPSANAGASPMDADAGDLRMQGLFGLQSGWGRDAADAKDPAPDRSHALDLDQFRRTPLWWAAKNGQLHEVERLLAQGANPNTPDIDGEAPLHAAARWGRVAVVEALLAHGADPRVKSLYGLTALHISVLEAQADTTRALLRYRADVNVRDLFGKSPLHDAVLRGNLELIALLLEAGADPMATDDSGTTPLVLAARAGSAALMDALSAYHENAKSPDWIGASCDDLKRQGQKRSCTN